MELLIQLVKHDELEDSNTILASGKGKLENDVLTYMEKDNPNVRHEVSFFSDSIVIKRFAEVQSEILLYLNKKGIARVISPYGVMVLETELEKYERVEDKVMIQYKIFQNEELVTYQKMIWRLKGAFT